MSEFYYQKLNSVWFTIKWIYKVALFFHFLFYITSRFKRQFIVRAGNIAARRIQCHNLLLSVFTNIANNASWTIKIALVITFEFKLWFDLTTWPECSISGSIHCFVFSWKDYLLHRGWKVFVSSSVFFWWTLDIFF